MYCRWLQNVTSTDSLTIVAPFSIQRKDTKRPPGGKLKFFFYNKKIIRYEFTITVDKKRLPAYSDRTVELFFANFKILFGMKTEKITYCVAEGETLNIFASSLAALSLRGKTNYRKIYREP